jgi:hypothetical protein
MTAPTVLPPTDPTLVAIAADQRLNGLGVILHAKPLVMMAMILLGLAIVAAVALSISQTARPTRRAGSAVSWLSAIAAGAPMLGLAAAAYGLMDACIGLANVRPVPSLSILAPGLAEAFFCITLGALASAIASVGGQQLKARLYAVDQAEAAPGSRPAPLARATA